MNVTRVRIEGFGPFYEPVEVSWSELGPIVAVVAPNGSGKTFLLEAPFACLYGFFPSRDHIAEELSQGGTGEGSIEISFLHKGVPYIASRQLGPNRHQAFLYRTGDLIAGDLIAGPKVRDFEAAVADLFGDSSTALATRLAAQGVRGDLTVAKPAERRAVMAELLAFDELQAIAEKCKDRAKDANGRAAGLSHHIGMVDAYRRTEDETSRILAGIRGETVALQADLSVKNAELANLTKQAEAHREWQARLAKAQDELGRAWQAVQAKQEALNGLSAQIAQARKWADELPQCTTAKANVQALKTDIHQLMEQKEAYERWRKALTDVERAERGLELAESKLAAADGAVEKPSQETIDLALLLPEAMEAYSALKQQVLEVQARNEDRFKARAELEAELKALQSGRAALADRAAKAPKTPGEPDVCGRCPLMKEWAGLQQKIEDMDIDIARAHRILEIRDKTEQVPSLDEVIAHGQRCRQASNAVAAYEKHVASLAAYKADVENARAILEMVHGQVPIAVEDPSGLLDDLRGKLADQQAIASRLQKALEAQEIVKELREKVSVATGELMDLEGKHLAAGVARDAVLCEAVDPPAPDVVRSLEAHTATIRTLIESHQRKAATLEGELNATVTARENAERGVIEYEEAITEAADYATLAQAFGPKGLQAILIDRAAPALETIAAHMLDVVTDGNLRLRIATQRALADGSIAEDFSIQVQDHIGERDVRKFSGGERNLLRLILRLALCLWLARVNGTSVESLAIDEAFDALDADNASKVLSLLMGMAGDFSQVVLITHNPTLADMVPCRVTLRKKPSGTVINIEGAA